MHPGNYCMYDMMQATRGVCGVEDVALRVYTRVIGHYPRSDMLLVDMGWTGCSAQGAAHGYGEIEGHPELRIHVLKQEAGESMLKPRPSDGGGGGPGGARGRGGGGGGRRGRRGRRGTHTGLCKIPDRDRAEIDSVARLCGVGDAR